MTTPGSFPDDYWRRPDPGPGDQPVARSGPPPQEGYAGPPPTTPPPTGWRPPLHVQPPPPRRLPPQDMAELDLAEQRAQRLTWTVGAVAGVVLLVLMCLLCSRLLF